MKDEWVGGGVTRRSSCACATGLRAGAIALMATRGYVERPWAGGDGSGGVGRGCVHRDRGAVVVSGGLREGAWRGELPSWQLGAQVIERSRVVAAVAFLSWT